MLIILHIVNARKGSDLYTCISWISRELQRPTMFGALFSFFSWEEVSVVLRRAACMKTKFKKQKKRGKREVAESQEKEALD